MAARLGIVRGGEVSARAMTAQSLAGLDRALRAPAELWLASASDEARVQGRFERAGAGEVALVRGSGGASVRVAPGTVHVLLLLANPAVLVPCDAKRLVNRYVRPLLRAMTRVGAHAHYFGRDWVSVGGRPVASVTFAHDAGTERTVFEAFVATAAPLWSAPRASFLGKEPLALGTTQTARLLDAIASAYAEGHDVLELEASGEVAEPAAPVEPPWTATRQEVIGLLGAGRDRAGAFRIGGELLVSRDALARLEAAAPTAGAELERAVDEALGAPGVALEGLRSLTSVRDVVREALAQG